MTSDFRVYQPFRYPILTGVLKEDFTALRSSDKLALGHCQAGETSNKPGLRVLEDYPDLRDILLNYFKDFAKQIGYTNDFIISTSWLTKLKEGDVIKEHNHANSFYSGVFYYGDYNDNTVIQLANPIRDTSSFELESNMECPLSTDWGYIPETNLLIVFPSSIRHSVPVYTGKEDRVSLAFNVIPKGCYGIGDSYIDTSWTQ